MLSAAPKIRKMRAAGWPRLSLMTSASTITSSSRECSEARSGKGLRPPLSAGSIIHFCCWLLRKIRPNMRLFCFGRTRIIVPRRPFLPGVTRARQRLPRFRARRFLLSGNISMRGWSSAVWPAITAMPAPSVSISIISIRTISGRLAWSLFLENSVAWRVASS